MSQAIGEEDDDTIHTCPVDVVGTATATIVRISSIYLTSGCRRTSGAWGNAGVSTNVEIQRPCLASLNAVDALARNRDFLFGFVGVSGESSSFPPFPREMRTYQQLVPDCSCRFSLKRDPSRQTAS